MSTHFPALVEAEVLRRLNSEHAEDSLLIVQELGQRPDGRSAAAVGLDGDGIDFLVTGTGLRHGDGESVRIAWRVPITQRAQIRPSYTDLYVAARQRRQARTEQGAA
ncbi:DUF2470 domain-containing protein [Nonomuraea sp. NPDC050663]|uniref:DUF2470 domain-containing protein n=1 Tax=Nonomuraea sp. NPDC050663 TaxID=3364370 RepID=UPI003798C278